MYAQIGTFYQENAATLPQAVRQAMQKQIKTIDGHNAMSIPDGTRDWFVYHMMKQAQRNNHVMSKMLEDFERRLQMLANSEQTQCPICLEEFNDTRRAETLGCCHCVCAECWGHWTGVMHGRPFCPLCRHADFVDVLAQNTEFDAANVGDVASAGAISRLLSGLTERSDSSLSGEALGARRPFRHTQPPSRFQAMLASTFGCFRGCGQVTSLGRSRRGRR